MNVIISTILGSVLSFLKEIPKYLVKFFKWMFSDIKNVFLVVLTVLLIILYFSFRSVKNDLENVVQEKNDTITVYKNKVGDLYAQKKTYITDIENLKKSNSDLYKEVKNLKDNPIVVTKVETVTEIKEIYIKDTASVVSPGIYRSDFSYKDKWCDINGYSILDSNTLTNETFMNKISFPNTITLNLIEKKNSGDISFIAKSDNPYFQINNIDGVMLSPEDSKALKKRFDKKWVIVGGIGATVTVYDKKVMVFPGLQITFGRKIFAF